MGCINTIDDWWRSEAICQLNIDRFDLIGYFDSTGSCYAIGQ